MPTYVLIYNRLPNRHIGPDVPPATVTGENPKDALKEVFKYSFRRVYGEAAKSPDIVLIEGTIEDGSIVHEKGASRRCYIAVSKVAKVRVNNENSRPKFRDPKTNRYTKRKA